jgi:cell division protein FtsQ
MMPLRLAWQPEGRALRPRMARTHRRLQSTQARPQSPSGSGGFARALLSLTTAGAVATGLAYAGCFAYRWATTAPAFAIHAIEIRGNQRAAADELVRMSGLSIGENIFTSDVDGAQSALLGEPWVKSVEVHRRLPDALVIRVAEREPALLVDLGKLYFADADGTLFKRATEGDALDLPIVTGLSRSAFQDQREQSEATLRDLVGFIEAYRTRGLEARYRIEELRTDAEDGLTVQLSRVGTRGELQSVKLGEAPYEEKLERLGALWAEFGRRGMTAQVVHLENRTRPNWVAVKLATAAPKAKPD